MDNAIALIGLGVIGTPIAHNLFVAKKEKFYLVASGERRKRLENNTILINDDIFAPKIISSCNEIEEKINLIIVCVKNYDLKFALDDIKNVVNSETIILPLQNGIFAYEFLKNKFPNNKVLRGYVQGPNTEIVGNIFTYQNSGVMHIGSDVHPKLAKQVYKLLKQRSVSIIFEKDISRMVWKKWMLNVAGNSVTALTGADYSLFKMYDDLQEICILAMREFVKVAHAEGIDLDERDISEVIEYYVSYCGSKKTSMLMDVLSERKTENEYLAGTLIRMAKTHGINVPVISTLYYLIEVKEEVYMEKKGLVTMKNLFTEGINYSDALRMNMKDIDFKMQSNEYAKKVNSANTEELNSILLYAVNNTEFYAKLKSIENLRITDFPVMNKILLNEHYEEVLVHSYDNIKTHKMHTSGSTGIPFTVVQDLAKRERHIADLKYFGAMAGYTDHSPMCYLRAKPTATLEEQERDNIWQLDICNLNEKNLTEYYQVMVEKKCTALMGYSSTLETAVDFWKKHFTNESMIKTIISTSETLTDNVKSKLRDFFGYETSVYARYSNMENGILGQETSVNENYCLNWASYYFELLKLDSDEPAKEGELGRIIVTDLYNKAFPMIRYDTGDVAKMSRSSDSSLPEFCELYGRRMDMIYDTYGEAVSPSLIGRTMRLSKGVEQWQFIQESENEYVLKITANSDNKPDLSKELESFKNTLGSKAQIQVVYVENIPVMSSLKRKLIVSNYKK